MKRFVEDIEELSEKNKDLRRVLHTSKHLQLVLTSLKPGEETGDDVHPEHDHFFRVERGKGELVLEGDRIKLKSNDAVIVPAGAHHNVINTGEKPLKMFMIYAPPHDPVASVPAAAATDAELQ
ncbi:MAG TPA: cupin domain-containing protein [Methylocystis sp.]|nr:cupin domain-containing protein [Methylocystis sp.]